MPQLNPKALNIWTARIVPLVLVGIVAYSTWVIIVLVCGQYATPASSCEDEIDSILVNYLLNPAPTVRKPRHGVGIAILTIYACLLLLLALTYFRLIFTVATNPGYTPRGPQWHAQKIREMRPSRPSQPGSRQADPEKGNGVLGALSTPNGCLPASSYGPLSHTSTPSLQEFYMRDVFSCESDGRPIWCSTCLNWKLDRAHHCREVGRCVRKMDHFCPW